VVSFGLGQYWQYKIRQLMGATDYSIPLVVASPFIAAAVFSQVLLVLGSIAVTASAGLVFCWLRLRSRSLIAPVMAHAATDGLALAVAWFAIHPSHLFG
jgi:hypothetical protein